MSDDWMSLSQVSQLLGVHPSTVRNWSDRGRLPVHRTQGGHRRYRRSELDLWLQSQRMKLANEDGHVLVQSALKRIRLQISEGRLEEQSWYRKMDEEARLQYRRSGRDLLQGLAEYLSSAGTAAEAEPRSLGYEYASRGWRCGLSYTEAVRAFLFFRNLLLEAMFSVFEAAAVQTPEVWSAMFRRVSDFTDQIQLTLLDTYEAYQRGNPR
jgi:excisionase family DNA binding protein